MFWRVAIDSREVVQNLMKFDSRVIIAINIQLTEIDIIVLMRTFIFVMERFKDSFMQDICQILKNLFSISLEIQTNTLQFWINYLMNNSSAEHLNNLILNVIKEAYADKLGDSLVQLARIPAVLRNEEFFNFLNVKFNQSVLKASGFRINRKVEVEKTVKEQKERLIEMGGPENTIQIDSS